MKKLAAVAVLASLVALGGCNKFGYDAHIDSLHSQPGSPYLQASGWLHDAFQAKRGEKCPILRWQVDGVLAGSTPSCVDFTSRPDVDAAKGAGSAGFAMEVATGLSQGRHRACLDVVPGNAGDAPFSALDCADVTLPISLTDHSAIDAVDVSGSTVTATGWYSELFFTLSQRLDYVAWSLDGVIVPADDTATVTRVDRPDVAAVYGEQSVGLALSKSGVAAGSHRLCIGLGHGFATDVVGTITCRMFTVS